MLTIHPNAHTTLVVRTEIARSPDSSSALAKKATTCPPRPSANGASAAPMRVRTARRDPIKLPHLNRDAVYRILKAEELNRLPPSGQARKSHGTFKDYEVGFVQVEVKHLPKLRDHDGSIRNRYLFVAINRASRYIHLAVKADETTGSKDSKLTV